MDGTILPNTTGLLEAARFFKTEKKLLDLEDRFTQDLIDTTQFTQMISQLWGAIPKEVSREIFYKTPKLENLERCFTDIHENGDFSCIITLSQDFFAEHFKDYGVDYIYSTKYPPNHTDAEDLKCLTAADKKNFAIDLSKKLNIHLEDCVAFGDSAGDLPLFETVGYSVAVNPSKELSKYVSLTYRGTCMLEAYKSIKKYIGRIQSKNYSTQSVSCENLNYGRSVVAKSFIDCITELYNCPCTELHFKSFWLQKIKSNPFLTPTGWYVCLQNLVQPFYLVMIKQFSEVIFHHIEILSIFLQN